MTSHSPYPTDRSPGLWLGLSIASCLLCCLPLGVVGVVYAALALGAQGRGDIAEMAQKTHSARLWTLWSVGVAAAFFAIAICAGLTSGG